MNALRNTRAVIGLIVLAGLGTAIAIGFITGFFQQIINWIIQRYDALMAWLSEPMSWDHAAAGLGVLIVPLVFVFVLMALTDQ